MRQQLASNYNTFQTKGNSDLFQGMISGNKQVQGNKGKAIDAYGKYSNVASGVLGAIDPKLGAIAKVGADYQQEMLKRIFGKEVGMSDEQRDMFNQNEMAIESNTDGILGAMGNFK